MSQARSAAMLLAALAAMAVSCIQVFPAIGAEGAPVGAWRATDRCFLSIFLLTQDGTAHTSYLTGEHDERAIWTWDGTTLRITSRSFDLDMFTGHVANGHIEAEYVWHDLDRDELHEQACVFEPYVPFGI